MGEQVRLAAMCEGLEQRVAFLERTGPVSGVVFDAERTSVRENMVELAQRLDRLSDAVGEVPNVWPSGILMRRVQRLEDGAREAPRGAELVRLTERLGELEALVAQVHGAQAAGSMQGLHEGLVRKVEALDRVLGDVARKCSTAEAIHSAHAERLSRLELQEEQGSPERFCTLALFQHAAKAAERLSRLELQEEQGSPAVQRLAESTAVALAALGKRLDELPERFCTLALFQHAAKAVEELRRGVAQVQEDLLALDVHQVERRQRQLGELERDLLSSRGRAREAELEELEAKVDHILGMMPGEDLAAQVRVLARQVDHLMQGRVSLGPLRDEVLGLLDKLGADLAGKAQEVQEKLEVMGANLEPLRVVVPAARLVPRGAGPAGALVRLELELRPGDSPAGGTWEVVGATPLDPQEGAGEVLDLTLQWGGRDTL